MGVFFAWAVVVLDFSASIGYAFNRDWRHSLMWFCWGLATVAVNITK
jgi:hypothetical protein